ncbi:hypothetical protein T11_17951 [Trichinella zimbabwensis]|uniref:Uncharacterized protein n=1 Tax=Trichinella zimbabwensis TaxID=268475 RepID=A0A0V1HUB5_9BILA|nr:hypothetical protein T11_17951 [Trichinella zimbabwensis]
MVYTFGRKAYPILILQEKKIRRRFDRVSEGHKKKLHSSSSVGDQLSALMVKMGKNQGDWSFQAMRCKTAMHS